MSKSKNKGKKSKYRLLNFNTWRGHMFLKNRMLHDQTFLENFFRIRKIRSYVKGDGFFTQFEPYCNEDGKLMFRDTGQQRYCFVYYTVLLEFDVDIRGLRMLFDDKSFTIEERRSMVESTFRRILPDEKVLNECTIGFDYLEFLYSKDRIIPAREDDDCELFWFVFPCFINYKRDKGMMDDREIEVLVDLLNKPPSEEKLSVYRERLEMSRPAPKKEVSDRQPDSKEYVYYKCSKCGVKLRMPADHKHVIMTCTRCGAKYDIPGRSGSTQQNEIKFGKDGMPDFSDVFGDLFSNNKKDQNQK